MDFKLLRKQTLLSDRYHAMEICTEAIKAEIPAEDAIAHIYRAGYIAGRCEAYESRNRVGRKLTEAHGEIKRLKAQLATLQEQIKPTPGVEEEAE